MHRLVDLHTHSYYSDGTSSPSEVVKHAVRRNVEILALADHDTVDGVAEARGEARRLNIRFIPAVEISTCLHDHLHILGYGINTAHAPLIEFLQECRKKRIVRIRTITQQLQAENVLLDYEEVAACARNTVSRPHVADLLVKKGYAVSRQDAFRKYLTPGKPGYVQPSGPDIFETMAQITSAGGVPVLAHPGIVQSRWDFPAWTNAGLRGIEVYYPLHKTSMMNTLEDVAEKYGLFITGGSDYHGPDSGREKEAGIRVPEAAYNKLEELFF
ncbi:MAG: PHP domain-containing protein [Elusimicrobiaceae bacterium]|jgi:hypothetical protein